MEKKAIFKTLQDWNFWQKEPNTGIQRPFYLKKLTELLQNKQVLAITGARRSGKSFLMRQLAKCLIKQGIDKNNILIINLEDPRLPSNLNTDFLQKIYEVYLEFIQPQARGYVLLDEIQEVEKWEKWVLMMQELQKAQIIISGSNAKLLSQELATLLTGRHLDLAVSPLSFSEFLLFNNLQIKNPLDLISHEIKIKANLKNYLKYGSFPEVVLRQDKTELLLTYFRDILEKDLIKRYKIRKIGQFKSVLKFYLSNIANLITFNSLEKHFKVSADTVEKFSSYFETAYVLFFLKRFSFKVKEQDKSPRKVYAIDTGLVNTVGFRFSPNDGRIMENIVFLELKRKQSSDLGLEIYYWKDERHREVDFVIKQGQQMVQLIQVCWQISDFKTKDRELKSLVLASQELKCNNLLVITDDFEGEEKLKGKKVKFVPLWRWLLEK